MNALHPSMLNGKNRVTKANALIEARYCLSVEEQRFILFLVSLIQPKDSGFKIWRITVKDLQKLYGLTGKAGYERIKKVSRSLLDKKLYINSSGSELELHWLASCEYFSGKGYLEVEISEKLRPYLLELKRQFTTYPWASIAKLRGKHTIRLYEILKQYEAAKRRTVSVDQLKKMLGVGESAYPEYAGLKRRVIEASRGEINRLTDLRFDYEEIKTGRRVTTIVFLIAGQRQAEKKLLGLMTEMGLAPKQARQFISKGTDYIEQNLTYVRERWQAGKVEDLASFAYSALRNDYRRRETPLERRKADARARKARDLERQAEHGRLMGEFKKWKTDLIARRLAELSGAERKKLQEEFDRQHHAHSGQTFRHPVMAQCSRNVFMAKRLLTENERNFKIWEASRRSQDGNQ